MPLCHRDHTPESISLQQRSVAKVQLSLPDSVLGGGPGCWAGSVPWHHELLRVWEQPSPVATCRGQLVIRIRWSLSFKTTPTSPAAPPG